MPFIIETGTWDRTGMTTGLMRPGLVYERWLPFCLASRSPILKTTFSRSVQLTGVNRGKFKAPAQHNDAHTAS
jgi:hypothetical protein